MRTCQLEGCGVSIEHMRPTARFCCDKHYQKTYRESPENKKAKKKAYDKAYQKAYRQTHKAYMKEYRQKPEVKARQQTPEAKARRKVYRERPEVKTRIKSYNQTLEYKAYQKAYNQSPEGRLKSTLSRQKRKARIAGLVNTFSDADWYRLILDFDCKCAYCVVELNDKDRRPWLEHFVPVILAGPFTPENIILTCENCNLSKHDTPPEDYLPPKLYRELSNYLDMQKNDWQQLEIEF